MSKTFIIEYAGLPVKLPAMVVCREEEATPFPSEAAAVIAIGETNLPSHQFRVVPLSQEIFAA